MLILDRKSNFKSAWVSQGTCLFAGGGGVLRKGGDWWRGLFANIGAPAGGRPVAEQCTRAVLA